MQPTQYDIMRQAEDHHWWYKALRGMVARDVVELSKGRARCRILDAGCGTGGMLHWLRAAGGPWELGGLDISPAAVEHTRARGFDHVEAGSVNAIPLADASQDIVLCLDVLYHVDVEPAMALAEMSRVLQPGGHIVLNLAAFDILRGSHDDVVHGARRYTPWAVRQLVQDAGFEVKSVHCWNAWLFPSLLVMRLLSRMSRRQADGDLRQVDPTLNAVLTGIARADTMATRLLQCPIGTSVYVIASKPVQPPT